MSVILAVIFCLLVASEPVNCQRGEGNLQPWMRGTIAVAVFLVLAGIAFAVNRFWCQAKQENSETSIGGKKEDLVMSNGTEGQYSTNAEFFRSKEGSHVYQNTIEIEDKVLTTVM